MMCCSCTCFTPPHPRVAELVRFSCFSQVDYAVIASQAGATLNNLLSHAQELVAKLRSLQLDQREFVCLKFLVLFSLGEFLTKRTLVVVEARFLHM